MNSLSVFIAAAEKGKGLDRAMNAIENGFTEREDRLGNLRKLAGKLLDIIHEKRGF